MIVGSSLLGFFSKITPFVFNDTISANVMGYDVFAKARTGGWDGVKPLEANITINSGVYVYGSATVYTGALSGLACSTLPDQSLITINNSGNIMGGGGAPHYFDTAGPDGAAAISVDAPIVVNNIGAGTVLGGGGGGASVTISTGGNCSGGGGAGGGEVNGDAKALGGAPGANGQNGHYWAAGLLYMGGAGGRVVPTSSTDTTDTVGANWGVGGSGGGAGARYTGTGSHGGGTTAGANGGANNTAGGGGGWGQQGGSGTDLNGVTYAGGAAGKAIFAGGKSITTTGTGFYGAIG